MKRRLFSLFLALTLVVGMLPAPAFAQETEPTQVTEAPTEAPATEAPATEAPAAEPTPAPTEALAPETTVAPAPTEAPTEAPATEAPATEAPAAEPTPAPTEAPVPETTVAPASTEVPAEPASTEDEAVAAVQAMIDALPDVGHMSESYLDALVEAYSAYDALSESQQAKITDVEKLEALFGWVNSQVSTLAEDVMEISGKETWENRTITTPVKLTGETTLTLVGDNKIQCDAPLDLNNCTLTIKGNGSLTVIGNGRSEKSTLNGAIFDSGYTGNQNGKGNLYLEGGTVKARGGRYNAISVCGVHLKDGNLEAYGGSKAGIVCSYLYTYGGSLYATGDVYGIRMMTMFAGNPGNLPILASDERDAQKAEMDAGDINDILDNDSGKKTYYMGEVTGPMFSVKAQKGYLYEGVAAQKATFAISYKNLDGYAVSTNWEGTHAGLKARTFLADKVLTVTADETVKEGTYTVVLTGRPSNGNEIVFTKKVTVTVLGAPITVTTQPQNASASCKRGELDAWQGDKEIQVAGTLADGVTEDVTYQWKLVEDDTVLDGFNQPTLKLADLYTANKLTPVADKPWLSSAKVYCTLTVGSYSVNTDPVTLTVNTCDYQCVDHVYGKCLQCGEFHTSDPLLVNEDGYFVIVPDESGDPSNVGGHLVGGGTFFLTKDVIHRSLNAGNATKDNKDTILDLQKHTLESLDMGNFPYGSFTLKNGTLNQCIRSTATEGKLILDGVTFMAAYATNNSSLDITVQGKSVFKEKVSFSVVEGVVHLRDCTFEKGIDTSNGAQPLALLDEGFAYQDSQGNIVDASYAGNIDGIKIQVVAHTCKYVNGKCECGRTCDHKTVDADGYCTVCKSLVYPYAIGEVRYTSLEDALTAAKEGDTITLRGDFYQGSKTVEINKSVTLNLGGHTLTGDADEKPVLLVLAENVTIRNGTVKNTRTAKSSPAVTVGKFDATGMMLTVKSVTFIGSATEVTPRASALSVQPSNVAKVENGTFNGGIYVEGDLIMTGGSATSLELGSSQGKAELSGGSFGSILIHASQENYKKLLVEGYAYQSGTSLVKPAEMNSSTKVEIIKCTHPDGLTATEACPYCGKTCSHEKWTDGKCAVCGYVCLHESVTEHDGGVPTCDICHLPMTVMVTADGNVSYTTDLAAALNNAGDGTTVTLLGDVSLEKSANIEGGKKVTLNLNDHNITRATEQTISVKGSTDGASAATLVITGSGNIPFEVKAIGGGQLDMSRWKGTVDSVTVQGRGEFVGPTGAAGKIERLNLVNWEYNRPGAILLQGGTIGGLYMQSNTQIRLGNLLKSGYAAKSGSEYLLYDRAISQSDNTLNDLTIVPCPHTGLDSSGRCTYCGATGFVATVTKDGVTAGYTDFQSALDEISEGKRGTLKLLKDVPVEEGYHVGRISGILDLNGKNLAGKLVCAQGSNLQIVNRGSDMSGMGKLEVLNGAKVTIADTAGSINFSKVTVESGSVADLLPEGSAYIRLIGQTWISAAEAAAKTLEKVAVKKAPVQSVTLIANEQSVPYGESQTVTLSASATLSQGFTASYAWAEVKSDGTVQTFPEEAGTGFTLPEGVNAGKYTYRVSITADGYTLSKDIQITVTKAPGTLENKNYPIQFTYGQTVPTPTAENFTTNNPDGAFDYYYWATEAGSILEAGANPTSAGTYTLFVSWAEGTNHTAANLSLKVTIQKAKQTADITVVNETISGKGDGGVTLLPSADVYEIRKKGETTFEAISASQGETFHTLTPGVYEIRLAETKNYLSTAPQEVTVKPGRKLTLTLPTKQEGYTLTANKTELDWHEDVELTFQLNPVGAYKAADFGIWAEAGSEKTKLTLGNDGAVKLTAPEKDITITVTGVKTDNVAPKVFIQGRLRKDSGYHVKWEGFQETPTDDFVNGDFVISATDRLSGVVSLWYCLSKTPLTRADMDTASWKQEGKVSITEDGVYYLYAKALDKANNAGYACTGKLVKESNPPTFSGVENGKTYYVTQQMEIHDDGMPDWYITNGSIGVVPNGGNENPIKLTLVNNNSSYSFEVGDRCGNEASITVYMKPLTDLTQPLYSILEESIQKTDRAILNDVEATLKGPDVTYATEPEKKEINDALARIEKLRQVLKQVAAVEAQIDALPDSVEPYQQTVEDNQIKPARKAYSDLTDHQKTLVDSAKLDKLGKLEAQLNAWKITEGDGQTWYKGSWNPLSFTVNGQTRKFSKVLLDGGMYITATPSFLAVSGSTDEPFTLTLKPEFLHVSMEPGEHTLTVIYGENNSRTGTVTFTVEIPANYLDVTNKPEFDGKTTVTVDGAEYPIEQMNGTRYVNLPETGDLLTIYSFKDGTPAGSYTNYPTGMQVFRITRQEGGAKAEEITELANLLNYAGCSIRVSGKKGIRMITAIDQNVKKSLVSKAGLAGYTLEEYGTVVQWADTLGSDTLNLGNGKSNFAYKKGNADPIFAKVDGMIQYTNVLVGFTDAQCQPDLVMRPYIKLKDTATGKTVTLYGGSVTRSIGYVAWQNRDTYKQGTASYKYVWSIIENVDASKYPN